MREHGRTEQARRDGRLPGLPFRTERRVFESMRTLRAWALVAVTGAASWYGMMIVHELGHVAGAWLSGGRVARVVLSPLAKSRTDLSEHPIPMFVVWSGPVLGAAAPVVLWLAARVARVRLAFLLQAFAGFCLIANGAYLASAVVMPVGDAEEVLRLGTPLWIVAVVGIVGVAAG